MTPPLFKKLILRAGQRGSLPLLPLLPLLLIMALASLPAHSEAADFDSFLKPLLTRRCVKCHGGSEVNGDVNLAQVATIRQFLSRPELIAEMVAAIDANDMPPEGEPALDPTTRERMLVDLKEMLREATASQEAQPAPIRRLNRFQYNNTVKDLFRLRLDVFKLPEKLMTRHGNYVVAGAGRMPDRVEVASHSLSPAAGLRNVEAFPKDLRASSGFDNQANQLTLSPLLLDAFLRLSVSIVESPDFNEENVGIWSEFFQPPADDVAAPAEVRRRLQAFLRIAFRGPVDDATLDRYTAYALSRMEQGLSFTDGMKKTASAALSSPMFLYRSESADGAAAPHQLASRLSYFLWSSCPDGELLELADSGALGKPDVLRRTVDRMLADPKIERFLDTFPAQWMQLENVFAATPDPRKSRLFRLDPKQPAGLQMVLEPLLLFDAVFLEDRPIIEMIAPTFGYQSEFLRAWYSSDLKPAAIDVDRIVEENRRHEEQRTRLEASIESMRAELKALLSPVRAELRAAHKKNAGATPPLELTPFAAWEFNDDLRDSINALDLQAHGKIEHRDGMVVLQGAYLLSRPLPFDLRAKTLEVWCQVHDLNQQGGGVMGIQGPGDFFDTIVLGERQPRHWISGSNGFSRTLDFPDSTPETRSNQTLHLAMVYAEDGTTTLYRDGAPYGKPFQKGSATFPQDQSMVIFGLRHLPPGGNKSLNVSIDKARLYPRALTAGEVAASARGRLDVSEREVLQALTAEEQQQRQRLAGALDEAKAALQAVPPPQDPQKLAAAAQQRFDEDILAKLRSRSFERVAASDPRYGGVITNAAVLSMTSGPKRTHPIARGAWIIEVIFNDPPPPPPNDVPPLNEESLSRELTIREKFAAHRENPSCAGCHAKLDPLGFALENFDITGRWRDKYENGRDVDASGSLMRKHAFDGVVRFKESLAREDRRFAKAFAGHLLRFALARELRPSDSLAIDAIVETTAADHFKLQALIREVVLSDRFSPSN